MILNEKKFHTDGLFCVSNMCLNNVSNFWLENADIKADISSFQACGHNFITL